VRSSSTATKVFAGMVHGVVVQMTRLPSRSASGNFT